MERSIHHLLRRSAQRTGLAVTIAAACLMLATGWIAARQATQSALRSEAQTLALALSQRPLIVSDAMQLLADWQDAHAPTAAILCDAAGRAHRPQSAQGAQTLCSELAARAPVSAHARVLAPKLPQVVAGVLLTRPAPLLPASWPLALAGALLLALVYAGASWLERQGLQGSLARPLASIAATAQRVTLYKDYTLRVAVPTTAGQPQEIQRLNDSFNAMLAEIDDRNRRLIRKGEELEKSRQQALAANQAKSQFLANVSHELRTPLNAIIGFSTMLVQQQFGPLGNPKYLEYSRDIEDAGKHLLDVINDILDLSRAESGSLKITIEACTLPKLVERALNIVAGAAHARKIDIYTDVPAKMPKLYADRVRVMQILLNLLANAIQYSSSGGKVVVRAGAEQGKNGVVYFTLVVEDEGVGMTPAQIQKAFHTFSHAEAPLNRKNAGVGLGLPLTKRLVELHHGKIKIESRPGEGTTVTVRLTSDPALLA